MNCILHFLLQGLFGTTPPADERSAKVQRRKFKKVPSSLGDTSTPSGQRKRPYSVIASSTGEKDGDSERRRRNSDGDLVTIAEQPNSTNHNPSEGKPTGSKPSAPTTGKKPSRERRKERKKRIQERSQEPPSRRLPLPEKHNLFSYKTGESSLPNSLYMNRSESAIMMTSSHRFVCPPERKRFYRSLLQSLKRTTGFAVIMGTGANRKMEEYRRGKLASV